MFDVGISESRHTNESLLNTQHIIFISSFKNLPIKEHMKKKCIPNQKPQTQFGFLQKIVGHTMSGTTIADELYCAESKNESMKGGITLQLTVNVYISHFQCIGPFKAKELNPWTLNTQSIRQFRIFRCYKYRRPNANSKHCYFFSHRTMIDETFNSLFSYPSIIQI